VNFLFSAVWRHRSALAVYNETSSSAEAEGGSGQLSMVMSAPQMANSFVSKDVNNWWG